MADWDVGRERKSLVLIKDRRMTDRERLQVLNMDKKMREGNETTAESTAL